MSLPVLHASSLFVVSLPYWKQMISFLGMWILICPPLGWMMALGYRKHLVLWFYGHGQCEYSLYQPSLRTGWKLWRDGVHAVGIILFYFLPTLCLFWYLGWKQPLEFSLFFDSQFLSFLLSCFLITPLSLIGTLLYYQFEVDGFSLSMIEGFIIGFLILQTVFMIPLGFMQLARRGLWRDAFRLDRACVLLRTHFQAYLLAWKDSILLTLGAFMTGYRLPQALAWSYMAIVWRFHWIYASQIKSKKSSESAPLPSSDPLIYTPHVHAQCILESTFRGDLKQTLSHPSNSLPTHLPLYPTFFCPLPIWWTQYHDDL